MLKKITKEEALNLLENEETKECVYYKREEGYVRVIDYRWTFDGDTNTAYNFLKTDFYLEVEDEEFKSNIEIDANGIRMEGSKTHLDGNVVKSGEIGHFKPQQEVLNTKAVQEAFNNIHPYTRISEDEGLEDHNIEQNFAAIDMEIRSLANRIDGLEEKNG